MSDSAVVSHCGRYRYRLDRSLAPGRSVCVFVMLNPSTADARTDDPTILCCMGFAGIWQFSNLAVFNLMAYRATNPAELSSVFDPEGPENDQHLRTALINLRRDDHPFKLVCAWGANKAADGPDRRFMRMAAELDVPAWCLGTTKDGFPRHPLYVARRTELVRYYGRAA